jgi:threonylcarbamoyladenosine tRNA methylthiotransferase MtaB
MTNELSGNQVVTFGCRLNIFESEVIKKSLQKSGEKNATIFNSCAVTSEAERQLRQSIRKERKKNPDKKIIVTGCAAQINPGFYANMPEVDAVLGNKEKLESKSYDFLESEETNVRVNDIMQLEEAASHMVTSFEGKARAFIEIQNGCNHRCTFCIIPFGRGNNRSVPIPKTLEHCNKIIAEGYNEIVLTGVDITDYGVNLPGKPKLGYLVKQILKHTNLKRIRLSSLDVAEIDDELKELIKSEKRLMPHFHLSLQSGDDMILKRMKRRHSSQEINEFCDFVKKHRCDAVIGADIITGFPTETEEMFNNSLQIVKNNNISMLHVFPYSEREGTPAAKIPQDKQVPKQIRKERARILIKEGNKQLENFSKKFIGQIITGITEENNIIKTDNFLKVRTPHNLSQGVEVKVKIEAFKNQELIGKIHV